MGLTRGMACRTRALSATGTLTDRKNGHNFMAMTKRQARSSVGAAEFKARCLELVDHVRETAAEYIVTRHGVPVATLGPVIRTPSSAFVGSMSGSVLAFDDPLTPIPGTWMAGEGD
jgi:prevent-host-death family protein